MSAIFELHLPSETLTADEVSEISGCQRKNDQVDWLNRNHWIFHKNKAGLPIVGRLYARMMLAGINPAALTGANQASTWGIDMSKVR